MSLITLILKKIYLLLSLTNFKANNRFLARCPKTRNRSRAKAVRGLRHGEALDPVTPLAVSFGVKYNASNYFYGAPRQLSKYPLCVRTPSQRESRVAPRTRTLIRESIFISTQSSTRPC